MEGVENDVKDSRTHGLLHKIHSLSYIKSLRTSNGFVVLSMSDSSSYLEGRFIGCYIDLTGFGSSYYTYILKIEYNMYVRYKKTKDYNELIYRIQKS